MMMELILFSLAILVSFYMLAQVTDLYFIPALERISDRAKLSSDVTGTTLMAMGSSAPELFIALIAVFRPGGHEEIGMGTIVGSALFNILVIIGASALARNATLSWKPIIRDVIFYLVAVGLLGFFFYNDTITIYEAAIMVLVYGVYIFAVMNWKKWFNYDDDAQEIVPEESSKKSILWRVFSPLDFLLKYTMPKAKWNWGVFIMSIVWISGLSWLLVESAIHVSKVLNIPEAIIALTVLAIGTSVPDLMSSYIVAKNGKGGMAISNAIGSNIFDILIGLGLPWLIVLVVFGREVEVVRENLLSSVMLLFGSVVVVLVILAIRKWKIRKQTGILLILIYLAYLVYQFMQL